MTIEEVRSLVPILERKVYGKPLVYFDNAATSQRPRTVVDMWNKITLESNANIHRAVHKLSSEATDAYEDARDAVKDFVGAKTRKEIVFTSGATASINLVAFSFGAFAVSKGDEIVVSESEHHSNLLPWQMLCQRTGAILKFIRVDDEGRLDMKSLDDVLSQRTKLVAVTHISNVLGLVNPIKEIIEKAHAVGARVLIDGSQGIVHCPVNVSELDCDFYVFSGHKMYAATGTGVLYAKEELLDQMPPFLTGGEMVGTVTLESSTFAQNPHKWEAGTQNFASSATLKPAIEFYNLLNNNELQLKLEQISGYLENELKNIEGLKLYGKGNECVKKTPIFSFTVEGAHHEDLALILDKMGVAVRSGQMCAEPLMNRMGTSGMLRASLAPYNTMEEAEYFIASLKKAINMLR